MLAHLDHYTNILRYWRSVETFSLPDVNWGRTDAEHTELKPGVPLPWENPEFPPPPENKRWKHTLYFHVVPKEAVIALLASLTGSAEYREPVGGETCMSALVLDHAGLPTAHSYAPVAFAHAIKLIRGKHNPELLTEELQLAQQGYEIRFGLGAQEEPAPITWSQLQKELAHLRELTADVLPVTTAVLCVSESTSLLATPDAPFLNSYYIQDLDTLIRHPQEMGASIQKLLTPDQPAARENLLDPRNLLKHLHPRDQPPGRWPANPAHGLYSAQLAALNIALATNAPILGINGPPGTGKTTLLREVVANVIVDRAKLLLQITDPNSLFARQRISIGEKAGYYPIDEGIFGNHGIVVASSNNNAIENISRELPQLKSIDRVTFPDVDYFSAIASNIFGEPAWGLISAVLGRSGNRQAFVDKFWFQKGRNFSGYLREQADQVDEARAHFSQTAIELKTLLQDYHGFQELASAYHDTVLDQATEAPTTPNNDQLSYLANRLLTEYDIPVANLPDLSFATLPAATIHRLTPYSSEKLNILRSTIFLRSLELHEWAIRANAANFQTNLGTFVDMLAGRYREKIDETVASILWNSFFFCIPIASVTLASFQRQFGRLRQGALGWLLLDEAGQATLPSIAGAIWRARRNIFIGDTRQIAPVVSIPQALDKLLQENYKTTNQWSPLHQSAQSLADRITPTGSWLDDPATQLSVRAKLASSHPQLTGSEVAVESITLPGSADSPPQTGSHPAPRIWTGIPLRAHRRCDEPMFTIANTIAYNGQMVRIDQSAPAKPQTAQLAFGSPNETAPSVASGSASGSNIPASTWLDIRGFTIIEGHALHEELSATRTLLQQLVAHEGKIFIISPFRVIAKICQEQFYKRGRIECGTIHTFQGREADMVILLLGTLQKSKKARDWVAATPNILNVAITRARHRLYVIGNYQTWSTHRYFDYLAQMLPRASP